MALWSPGKLLMSDLPAKCPHLLSLGVVLQWQWQLLCAINKSNSAVNAAF